MADSTTLVSTGDALSKIYGFTQKVSPLAAWPSTTTKYLEAEEVQEMAKFIIGKWRKDLQNIEIAYLFKQKASKNGETATYGAAQTVNEKQQVLHGYEAIIEIGYDTWIGLDLDQQLRLVHHELAHLAYDSDKGKVVTVTHPVEEFPETIRLFGPGKDADVEYIAAYNQFQKDHTSISAAVPSK